MEIKKLNKDIIERTRSSFTVNSISQCIFELVSNSIDAKSTAVAVRINLATLRIQVVDNGSGITKENLKKVGIRYMTNKCRSLKQLDQHVIYHGFRGEALASITYLCKSINITSRVQDSQKTFSRTIENGRSGAVEQVKDRPSPGTSITIEGFLTKLPVRQKRIIKEIEFEDVRKCLECLIIIHPKISFSLRDDTTGTLVFNVQKSVDIIGSFRSLHPEIDEQFVLLKVSKHKITVEGLIHRGPFENKKLQFVYVNRRPVVSHKIQRLICDFYQKCNNSHETIAISKKKHPIFVVNIKCPHSYVDILFNPSKTMVELKHFELIEHCLEKMMNSYFGKDNVSNKVNINKEHDFKSDHGVSQVRGAVQACGFKRKNSNRGKDILPKKCPKLNAPEILQNDSEKLPFENYKIRPNFAESDDNMFDFLLPKPLEKNNSKKCDNSKLFGGKKVTRMKPCLKTPFVRDKTKKQTQSTLYSGNYNIEDSAEHKSFHKVPKFTEEKFKRPLPIAVVANPQNCPKRCQSENSVPCREQIEKNDVLGKHNFDAKSTYSRLTDDEYKGKNLIMDMFLKSTQVFNSDSDSTGGDTIKESNFCFEQTVQDNVRRVNTTMSISVNVKQRKMKERQGQNIHNVQKPSYDKTSKCVQTNFFDNANMTSKCVQTSLNKHVHQQIEDELSADAVAENYTIVMASTVSKNPRLKFVRKSSDDNVNELFEPQNKAECLCQCNKSRYFNFKRLKSAEERSMCENVNRKLTLSSPQSFPSLENINISPIKRETRNIEAIPDQRYPNVYRDIDNVDICFNPRQNPLPPNFAHNIQGFPQPVNSQYYIAQNFHPYGIPGELIREYQWIPSNIFPDPYVMKSLIGYNNNEYDVPQSNLGPHCVVPDTLSRTYNWFNPEFRSTQINEVQNNINKGFTAAHELPVRSPFWGKQNYVNTRQYINENIAFPMSPLENNKRENEHNASLLRFNNNSKSLFSTNYNSCENSNGNFNKINKNSNFEFGKARTVDPTLSLSRLVISLNEKKKKVLLEKELQEANQRNKNKFLNEEQSRQKPTSGSGQKDKSRIVMDSQNEWIRKVNSFGDVYYVNQRTGMTSFVAPKKNINLFQFEKRPNFVPIGSSPILIGHKPVDKLLTQGAKAKLHHFIMESYENELLVIKWENYIEDDPNKFFEDLYLEKTKLYENCIPNVAKHNLTSTGNGIISFNKGLFRSLEIVGQVDKKFIAVLERKKNTLILFDQHAVHERIRLENLIRVYKDKKEICKEKIMFFISQNDLSILKNHEHCLRSLGLEVEFFMHGLSVIKIPTCLQQKFNSSQDVSGFNKAIDSLLKEVIDWLKSTRGAALKCVPKVIQDAINMEACRGAIKFGDTLNRVECEMLLKELVLCNLPFQCAHGRPTLTPLLTVQENSGKVERINLRKLNIIKRGEII